MSRVINFRAWNPLKNKMWYNQFTITSYGHIQRSEISREWHSFKNEDWILMQFTGLHDKNGKEIYEGDIVESKWMLEFVGEVKFNEFEIEETYEPIINTVLGWNVRGVSLAAEEWEIIGNIFENPELLEVFKDA